MMTLRSHDKQRLQLVRVQRELAKRGDGWLQGGAGGVCRLGLVVKRAWAAEPGAAHEIRGNQYNLRKARYTSRACK